MKTAIPKIKIDWLITFLCNQGIDNDRISHAANVNENIDIGALKFLPLADYIKLLNWSAQELSIENLGLELGKNIQSGDFGTLSLAAQHFCTLREMLLSIAQFHSLVSHAINIEFDEQHSTGVLRFKIILPLEDDIRQDIELTLAMFVAGAKEVFGKTWSPVEVTFTHCKPDNIEQHLKLFGEQISFGQPYNSIVYTKEDLDLALTNKGDDHQRRFTSQLQNLMDDVLREETLLANTCYYINLTLGTGHCDATSIAKLMHMSRRTMTRHLANMNTSFRKLKEDIILERSKQLLSSHRTNTSSIALDLGFSDSTAFSRAFKKLCKLTPSQYRENIRKEA